MSKFKDRVGQRFGRLIVLERNDNYKVHATKVYWLCQCDCGKTVTVAACNLGRSVNSCGCLKSELCKESIVKLQNKPHPESPLLEIYYRYKKDAIRRKIDFNLSIEEAFHFFKANCFYCGLAPETIAKARCGIAAQVFNGIDRVDNLRGYALENCVTACWQCNMSKRDYTKQQFIEWINRVHSYQEKHVVQSNYSSSQSS